MFTVWFGEGPAPTDTELIGPLRHLPSVTVERAPRCAWALSAHAATYASHPETGVRAWVWARIDNTKELCSTLKVPETNPAEIVVAGYLRWGHALPSHLVGDFSVCLHDPRNREVLAFRDPIGVRPLTIARSGDSTVVTTAPGVLWGLPGFVDRPDVKLIAQLAVRVRGLSMQSTHPQGQRVTPGYLLSARDGALTEVRYHHFDPESPWSSTPDARWVADFRSALLQAVADRVPAQGPIGIEFSGGLDSVGIAAVLRDLDASYMARVRAFAFTFFANEEAAIRAAAEALGVEHLSVDSTASVEQERDWWYAAEDLLGAPTSHDIALGFVSGLAACAADGGRTMFAGLGGDEGVTNPARQAPREWLRHAALPSATRYALPHSGWRRRAAVARSMLFGAQVPTAVAPSTKQLADALNLQQVALDEAGVPEQIAWETTPASKTSVNSTIVRSDGTLQPITAAYWSRRAEECNTVASMFDMTYAFPLLAPAVLQQYLSTPTVHKFRNGLGRYLFREAAGSTLPAAVRWAPSKYMGPPAPRKPAPQTPDTTAIHPLLAQIMRPEAPLPGPAPGLASRNGVRRVNIWLHQRFPQIT